MVPNFLSRSSIPHSGRRLIRSRRNAYEQGQVATLTMDELRKSIRRPR